jgi:hypothetical protein
MRLSDLPAVNVQPIGGISEEIGAVEEHGAAEERLAQSASNVAASGAALSNAAFQGQIGLNLLKAHAKYQEGKKAVEDYFNQNPTMSAGQLREAYGGEQNIPPEVMKNIGSLTEPVTNPDGSVVERDKQAIPRYAYQWDLQHRRMDKLVEDIAGSIGGGPDIDNSFLTAAKIQNNEEMYAKHSEMAKEIQAGLNEQQKSLMYHALNGGDFETARQAVTQTTLTPDQKEKLRYFITESESRFPMNEIALGTDLPALRSGISGLRDFDKNGGKFDVAHEDGSVTHVTTSDLSEKERRIFIREMEKQQKRVEQTQKANQGDYNIQLGKAIETDLLKAHATGNWDAVRDFASGAAFVRSGLLGQVDPKDLKSVSNYAQELLDQRERRSDKWQNQQENVGTMAIGNAFEMAWRNEAPGVKIPGTDKTLDPRTMNVYDLGSQFHLKPGDVNRFAEWQRALLAGDNKPQKDPAISHARSTALNLLGLPKDAIDSTGTDEGKNQIAAHYGLAFEQFLQGEMAAHGGKMTAAQQDEAAERWAADPNQTIDHWYGTSKTDYPKLSDVPPDLAFHVQKLAGEMGINGTGAGIAKFWKEKLEPLQPDIKSAWLASTSAKIKGQPLDGATRVQLAGILTSQHDNLAGELESQGVQHPTQEQITRYYFNSRMNAGIPDRSKRNAARKALDNSGP